MQKLKLLLFILLLPLASMAQSDSAPTSPTAKPVTAYQQADTSYGYQNGKWFAWVNRAYGLANYVQKKDSVSGYVPWYTLKHSNITFSGTPTFNNGANFNGNISVNAPSYFDVSANSAFIDIGNSAIASLGGYSTNIYSQGQSTLLAHFGDGSASPTNNMPYLQVYKKPVSNYDVVNLRALDSLFSYGIDTFKNTPVFNNGLTGNTTTLTNGSGTLNIFGNVIQASNNMDLAANSVLYFPLGASNSIFGLSGSEMYYNIKPFNPNDITRLRDVDSLLNNNSLLLSSGSPQTVTQTPIYTNGINIPNSNTAIFLQRNASKFMYNYTDGVRQGEDLYIGNGSGNTTHTGHTTAPFEQDNVALGDSTLANLINGYALTTIGWNAGHSYHTVYSNTDVGYRVDELDTSGYGNSVFGTYALGKNLNANQMAVFGWHGGLAHTTGNGWAVFGSSAFSNNTTGSYNTGIGYQVGAGSTTGSYNVLIGANQAATFDPGSYRLMIDVSNISAPLIDGHFDTRLLTFNANTVTIAGTESITGNFNTSGGVGRALTVSPIITPTANSDIMVSADFLGTFNTGTGFLTATLTTPGSGYNNGTYTNVPLVNITGTGTGAIATVVVSGGAITSVTQTTGGIGYAVGNTFTFAVGFDGGTASGFVGTVATLGYNSTIKYSARFNNNPVAMPAISADPALTGNGSIWYNYNTSNFNIKANGTVYALNALPASVIASGTLGVARGGTGLSGYSAVGSLLYSASTSSTGQLADVATGSILTSGGTGAAPAYSTSIPNGVTATTQAASDNSTKVATTAYVTSAVTNSADAVNTATDANYIITTGHQLVILPVVTAGRTVSIPSASTYAGQTIKIWNQNTSGTNLWSFTNATVNDAGGNTLTSLVNGSVYILQSTGTVWVKEN